MNVLNYQNNEFILQGPSSITARNLVEVFVLYCFFVCIKLLGNVCESVP